MIPSNALLFAALTLSIFCAHGLSSTSSGPADEAAGETGALSHTLSHLLGPSALSLWLVQRTRSAAEALAQSRELQQALATDRHATVLNAFWAWSRAYGRQFALGAEAEEALLAFEVNLDIQLSANLAAAAAAPDGGSSGGAWYALNEYSATPHQALQTKLTLPDASSPVPPAPRPTSASHSFIAVDHAQLEQPPLVHSATAAAQSLSSTATATVTAAAQSTSAAAAAAAYRRSPRSPTPAPRSPKTPRALLHYRPPPRPPPGDGGVSSSAGGASTTPLLSRKVLRTSSAMATGSASSIAAGKSATAAALDLQSAAPTIVDWTTTGKLTPVRNQGATCASCWADAATSAMEAATAIAHNTAPVQLSSQMVIDCAHPSVSLDYSSRGCQGGDSSDAFLFMSRIAVAPALLYPATSRRSGMTGQCDRRWMTAASHADVTPLKPGPSGSVFYPPHHEGHLQKAVAHQPVVIYWNMGLNFNVYGGGVYDLQDQTHPGLGCSAFDIGALDHAMLVVGFNVEQNIWIIQNSFGTSWGENGLMRARMTNDSYGPCGMYWYVVAPQMTP